MEVYMSGTKMLLLLIISRRMLNIANSIQIQSPDGDVIDCTDTYSQPAFHHDSALRDHVIQMRPSISYPMEVLQNPFSEHAEPFWLSSGSTCPEGTIPIRKNTELLGDSILKARTTSAKSFENKDGSDTYEYATTFHRAGAKYYGAKAIINVWNPLVQEGDESSSSQIWVGAMNKEIIEAGWHVNPRLYKGEDRKIRFFIYWTTDGYDSTGGCYNLLCSGFIQVSRKILLGGTLHPFSIYQGLQIDMYICIFKDPRTQNWWLQFGDEMVGYWPRSLFSHLNTGATIIELGGEIYNRKSGGEHTTTEMGSGHFSSEGFGKASYFRNIQYVNSFTAVLRDAYKLNIDNHKKSCYSITIPNHDGTATATGNEKQEDQMGSYFYYGGPGRNEFCPG